MVDPLAHALLARVTPDAVDLRRLIDPLHVDSVRETAYHEARHAVKAHVLGSESCFVAVISPRRLTGVSMWATRRIETTSNPPQTEWLCHLVA